MTKKRLLSRVANTDKMGIKIPLPPLKLLLQIWAGSGNLGQMQEILISVYYGSIIRLDKLEFDGLL